MLRIVGLFVFCLALAAPTFSASLKAGDVAPQVELPEVIEPGKLQSLSALRGKVVYVDFWASWCGPCRVSFPILNDIRNEFHDQGFEVFAISVDEYSEDAVKFLQGMSVDYPTLIDTTGATPSNFGVLGMPTGFLVNRNGVIREVHQGFRKSDATKIRDAVMHLLAETGP